MQQVSLARIQRECRFGRNSTVEALPDMSDDDPRGAKGNRKIEVELHRDIIRQRRRCTPPAIGGDAERAAIEETRSACAGSRRERRRESMADYQKRIVRPAPSVG
jgi:hypothetical protein